MSDTPGTPPTTTDTFLNGLWRENPILVQVLGMCPTLAVTNTVINAFVMGLATTFVLVASEILVSATRRFIPKQVRIASYVLIIATFVTMADYIIQAVSLSVHRALGAFIALIVVNCIILGRAESFSSKNGIGRSALDALGMGIGFTAALLCLGTIRELLGAGTWAALPVLGASFEPWVVMILPAGGFFVLGGLMMAANIIKRRSALGS